MLFRTDFLKCGASVPIRIVPRKQLQCLSNFGDPLLEKAVVTLCCSRVLSIALFVSISSTHHFSASSSSLDKASPMFSTHSNYQVPWVLIGWLAWWFGCIPCIPSQLLVVTTYPWLHFLTWFMFVPMNLSHATLIFSMACFKWEDNDLPKILLLLKGSESGTPTLGWT
jgi:hypothetical protein